MGVIIGVVEVGAGGVIMVGSLVAAVAVEPVIPPPPVVPTPLDIPPTPAVVVDVFPKLTLTELYSKSSGRFRSNHVVCELGT